MKNFSWVLVGCLGLIGCDHNHGTTTFKAPPSKVAAANVPVFEWRISEYPSFAVFKVAVRQGLIDDRKGYQGTIEQKHNIDIVQRSMTYEAGMQEYSASGGGTCITNTDAPAVADTRSTTAFLALSTSLGGDAAVVVMDKEDPKSKTYKAHVDAFLKKNPTMGLDGSINRYVFDRCLTKMGLNSDDYQFSNKDPEAAAGMIQIGSAKSAMLWNPFVRQTLRNTPGTMVLFDSTMIPGEVRDLGVMDTKEYNTEAGQNAAKALCEAYYTVCTSLGKNPAVKVERTKENAEYEALGAEFTNLDAAEMRAVCEQTVFYGTPQVGIETFTGSQLPEVMTTVIEWTKRRQSIKGKTVIAYKSGDKSANLTFDISAMQAVQGR